MAAPRPVSGGPAGPALAPVAIGIGASTGGPKTLAALLSNLPSTLNVPIFVVQHIEHGGGEALVATLGKDCRLPVHMAEHDTRPVDGHIYVAPAGKHMTVVGSRFDCHIQLDEAPPVNYCRPAVDPLFESLPYVYGARVLAIILTGMGSDGVEGVRAIRAAGGYCLVQDEESCVVFGMPKAVQEAGEYDEILRPEEIATRAALLTARRAA
ncbi:MAG TPA: chemotaxis protein CheB [Planctomycetes bacterium]|nr:chemotaxis protein CheB [Planctomycetota bacterium]